MSELTDKITIQESNLSNATKKDYDFRFLDVLSINMVNGQDKKSGLGFLKDDSQVFKLHCEKKIINNPKKVGLDLKISYR